mgnify:CR=1 FL=1
MKYTVKNKEHDQDNINFIDLTDPKKEMPSFLEYEDVLTFSLENGYIYDESEIKSLCDGGDNLPAYFSSMNAADECEYYVENNSEVKFDKEQDVYELF